MLAAGCAGPEFKETFNGGTAAGPSPPPIYVDEEYPELLIIVSAKSPLSESYRPRTMRTVQGVSLEGTAAEHLVQMLEAAQLDGVTGLYIKNGYRSASMQRELFQNKVKEMEEDYGENAPKMAARVVALPGTSEHQTGLAVDFGSSASPDKNLKTAFAYTPEGKWLEKNAYKFGYILRYPKDGEKVTGFIYEPWHYRFVGKNVAKLIYENSLTLEEYHKMKEQGNIIAK